MGLGVSTTNEIVASARTIERRGRKRKRVPSQTSTADDSNDKDIVSDDKDIDMEVPMSQSTNNFSSAASAIEEESSTIVMDGGMFRLCFFHSHFKYTIILNNHN